METMVAILLMAALGRRAEELAGEPPGTEFSAKLHDLRIELYSGFFGLARNRRVSVKDWQIIFRDCICAIDYPPLLPWIVLPAMRDAVQSAITEKVLRGLR